MCSNDCMGPRGFIRFALMSESDIETSPGTPIMVLLPNTGCKTHILGLHTIFT